MRRDAAFLAALLVVVELAALVECHNTNIGTAGIVSKMKSTIGKKQKQGTLPGPRESHPPDIAKPRSKSPATDMTKPSASGSSGAGAAGSKKGTLEKLKGPAPPPGPKADPFEDVHPIKPADHVIAECVIKKHPEVRSLFEKKFPDHAPPKDIKLVSWWKYPSKVNAEWKPCFAEFMATQSTATAPRPKTALANKGGGHTKAKPAPNIESADESGSGSDPAPPMEEPSSSGSGSKRYKKSDFPPVEGDSSEASEEESSGGSGTPGSDSDSDSPESGSGTGSSGSSADSDDGSDDDDGGIDTSAPDASQIAAGTGSSSASGSSGPLGSGVEMSDGKGIEQDLIKNDHDGFIDT